MKLYRLLERIEYRLVQGNIEKQVTTVVHDSAKVILNSMFICIEGKKADGHDYVKQVIKQGASVIVMERIVEVPEGVTVILVDNTRVALAYIAAAYYGYPSEKLITIGVTGTKGKTTTSYMIQSILEEAGYMTGLIGTIEVKFGTKHVEAYNTTPDTLLLQKYLHEMVECGCRAVVMEVSSQGLMLYRVEGIFFDYGIFTNISPDHIGPNEHKSYEEYMSCKSKLFRQCRIGIVNQDCSEVDTILQGHTCSIETYGRGKNAMLYAENINLLQRPGALGITFYVGGLTKFCVKLWMPGVFNVYNALAAVVIAKHFHIEEEIIARAFERQCIKGRLELVPLSKEYTVMIDYAHNAVSLEHVLKTIKEYGPKRLICLFGCGGNRARARRYEMGRIAAKLADIVVVTSDNPREEEPEAIIDDIVKAITEEKKSYIRIVNREEAIWYCIEHAMPGDVILLAGKGHETYQEIKGIRYHMDEREILSKIVKGESSCKER